MKKKKEDYEPEQMTIPLSRMRKVTNSMSELPADTPISFEYILTAFFPTAWENIQKYAADCYTQGYLQATNEKK